MAHQQLPAHEFEYEIKNAINAYKTTINTIKQSSTHNWNNSIQPMEEASEKLDGIWYILEHENAVNNTPEIREVYEKLLKLITNLHTEILQDQELYNVYLSIKNSDEYKNLEVAQKSIIEHALRNFKLGGVNLDATARAQLAQLHEQLSALDNKFSNNVLDATQDWTYHVSTGQKFLLDGLPERVIIAAHERAVELNKSGWVLTLDTPTVVAVTSYAANRQLREEFYMAYNTRASDRGPMAGKYDNTPIMAQILSLRQQIAQKTGYKNYAEYSLVSKMAPSVADVHKFLGDLVDLVKPQAEIEYAQLKAFALQQGFAQELEAWDVGYFEEKMREQHFNISDEELRAYFPEPKVISGLFKLANKIFDLQIEEVQDIPKWHDRVRMYKITDAKQEVRGYFYIDLYTREGKRGGAWMSECVGRMRFANHIQEPIAYLNCNFAPPIEGQPGLLTHQDVLTLFHEFGHSIHHVLTQVDYHSVAGLNGVEWDAVELPSQFMENWAWEWEVIQDISENVFNGEPMPRALYDKLKASKNFHAGLYLLRQLLYAMFDLRMHEVVGILPNVSAHQVVQDLRKEIAVVPVPEDSRFENSFGHIFSGGYAAGYYSYLWAEVLSCDAYAIFTQETLFNKKVGNDFLVKILEKGGSEPAMDLFVAFAGREPKVDALLKHHALTQE